MCIKSLDGCIKKYFSQMLPLCVQLLSCVRLFAIACTVALQVPLSMGFPRQEYWSGLPFPSPRDLPKPGIEPTSPALADRFFTTEPSGKPKCCHQVIQNFRVVIFPLNGRKSMQYLKTKLRNMKDMYHLYWKLQKKTQRGGKLYCVLPDGKLLIW